MIIKKNTWHIEQGDMKLNGVEIFPPPESFPTFDCSIPDLPEPRRKHSISRLSGGRLVVCGGYVTPSTPDTPSTTSTPISVHGSDSCIYWAANKLNITSWTDLFKMRLLHQKHPDRPNSLNVSSVSVCWSVFRLLLKASHFHTYAWNDVTLKMNMTD